MIQYSKSDYGTLVKLLNAITATIEEDGTVSLLVFKELVAYIAPNSLADPYTTNSGESK